MPITWPDDVDEIIGGDLTAALAYVTPAGGAVVTAVAPVGLRDRDAGTVSFTTSLGLGKKLERIARNPRVALAYHAREHGFADGSEFVLVQGDAQPATEPDRSYLEDTVRPQATRFMGPPKEGKLFWDRWLREYYQDRVPVAVDVERVTVWEDDRCAAAARHARGSRSRRAAGTEGARQGNRPARRLGARRDAPARAGPPAARVRRRRRLSGGRPGRRSRTPARRASGSRLSAALPPGGRRAGLLAHSYRPKLIGLAARQHTGWLTVDEEGALYAPHTESGFRAPANKTALLLANGLLAKRGLRKARRAAAAGPSIARQMDRMCKRSD